MNILVSRLISLSREEASGAATAQRGKDYTFRLNRKQGYTYTVSARIGGNEVTCTYDEAKGTYTIPAKDARLSSALAAADPGTGPARHAGTGRTAGSARTGARRAHPHHAQPAGE